ncbi:MAG: ribosome silencing factor [bacterium]
MNGVSLAKFCRSCAADKKAADAVILDLRKIDGPAEFFFICSAQSDPQIKAIANHIEQTMKEKHRLSPWAVHGTPASRWMVMDYGSVLVHVMHEEKRAYYNLENLWHDADRVA